MPRHSARTLILIACIAAGTATLGAASAGARDVDMYDSRVTFSEQPPAFHGSVRSDHRPCKNDRHVAVFRKRNGADRKLGGDTTGPAGRWSVPVMLSSGAYYARVRAKQRIVSGNGYTCAKDRSRTVVVD